MKNIEMKKQVRKAKRVFVWITSENDGQYLKITKAQAYKLIDGCGGHDDETDFKSSRMNENGDFYIDR